MAVAESTAGFGAGGSQPIVALVPDAGTSTLRLTAATSEELSDNAGARPLDDRIDIGDPEADEPQLDGVIELGFFRDVFRGLGCGAFGMVTLLATAFGLICPMLRRRR